MAYEDKELSIDSAEPVELYVFTYNGISYSYTSSQFTQQVSINGDAYIFSPEYIERGAELKLGNSSNTEATCTITVLRNNSIALLYQGAPPEQGTIDVSIYRMHGENSNDIIRLVYGVVSQVSFKDSTAELTITIEDVLNRNIPRGFLSYFCQNCVYDVKCTKSLSDYELFCRVDKQVGLSLYSEVLATKEDDYFTDGFIIMGNSYRQVLKHKGPKITLKYPIPEYDQKSSFTIYPGCNGNFRLCHERFGNTDNFSGIPYIQPYNAFRKPVGTGVYWVDGNIVYRNTNGELYNMDL